MERVNEKSTAYLTITFRDKAGAALRPQLLSHRRCGDRPIGAQ